MRIVEETVLEDFDLGKITKLVVNKTMESETIVEGNIIDFSSASVFLSGVTDSSKGKELKESRHIKGTLLVSLDKNNYELLENANYEFVQSYLMKGEKVDDLFRFVEKVGESYIVEI